MLNTNPKGILYRSVGGLAGLAMISMGVAPIFRSGDFSYRNWFGGLVFAPIAILAGVFTIYCAIFKPEWLAASSAEGKSKKKS